MPSTKNLPSIDNSLSTHIPYYILYSKTYLRTTHHPSPYLQPAYTFYSKQTSDLQKRPQALQKGKRESITSNLFLPTVENTIRVIITVLLWGYISLTLLKCPHFLPLPQFRIIDDHCPVKPGCYWTPVKYKTGIYDRNWLSECRF